MDGGFTRVDGWRFHTTRRMEVLIRLDGRDGRSSSIMCSYILGLYVNPSGYMLVRTARNELIFSGRDSE